MSVFTKSDKLNSLKSGDIYRFKAVDPITQGTLKFTLMSYCLMFWPLPKLKAALEQDTSTSMYTEM